MGSYDPESARERSRRAAAAPRRAATTFAGLRQRHCDGALTVVTPRKSKLPLDDLHWLPMIMAHHFWSEKLVGTRLSSYASDELRKQLARGKLRCRRQDTTGKFELVPRTFWRDHEIDVHSGAVEIYCGPREPHGRDHQTRVNGLFFVWRPDLDQFWSTAEAEQELPMGGKPGPKPTENWKLHVAGELHRIVVVERKQPPPASYFAQFCEDKSGYHPDIGAVQRLLRELLG